MEQLMNSTWGMALFFIGQLLYVSLVTIKTIVMYDNKPIKNAIANAVTYGLYVFIIIFTAGSMNIWIKFTIVTLTNFIGAYVSTIVLNKMRKDKLWKVEVTIPTENTRELDIELVTIPHSYIEISPKHTLFSFYCDTQKQSHEVRETAKKYNAKFFATESKNL